MTLLYISLRYLNPVLYFPMTCLDFLKSQKKAVIMQLAMSNIKVVFSLFTLFPILMSCGYVWLSVKKAVT